ncbi:MAG: hypothetical protein MJZ38_05805 [archaeon]|nr:hypothetical protein [archaeon]
MGQAGWVGVIVLLSSLVVLFSALASDWISLLASLFCLIASPVIHRGLRTSVMGSVLGYECVALGVILMLGVLRFTSFADPYILGNIHILDVALYMMQPVVVFIQGFIVAAVIDLKSDSSLSKRWMIMLAVGLAFSFVLLGMFMTAFSLWDSGQPFGPGSPGSFHDSNMSLMLPCDIAAFTILASAIVCRGLLDGVEKSELCQEVEA